jgi:hypothetical protein
MGERNRLGEELYSAGPLRQALVQPGDGRRRNGTMAKTTPRQQRDLNNPSSPNSPTLSPTPRRTSSILTSPPSRGPLVASAETSYHKRLRAILLDHKRCRREWNELVIRGCLSRTRAAIELWTDIEYVRVLAGGGLKLTCACAGSQSSMSTATRRE